MPEYSRLGDQSLAVQNVASGSRYFLLPVSRLQVILQRAKRLVKDDQRIATINYQKP